MAKDAPSLRPLFYALPDCPRPDFSPAGRPDQIMRSPALATRPRRLGTDKPVGYVHPLSHTMGEAYERYATHPAAPVPPRTDTGRYKVVVPLAPLAAESTAAQGVRLQELPEAETRDPHPHPPPAPKRLYVNPGFPKATRDPGWNRFRSGDEDLWVAWLREGPEDGVLPDRPKGPRWETARPPGVRVRASTGWWESGGG